MISIRTGLILVSVAAALVTAPACSLFDKDDPSGEADGGVGAMCTANAQCSATFVCAGGSCQLAGSVGLGGDCWANRDCGPDLFCSARGICAPSGDGAAGDPCGTGAECQPHLVCQAYGFSGQCAEPGTAELGESCSASTDCIAGLACAQDGTCKGVGEAYPPFTGVECEPDDEDVFKVYFEVPRPGAPPADFFRLPFPNDARVDASGNLLMDDFPRPGPTLLGLDLVDLYADALVADFDGFSSVAPVTFRFSKQFEFASLGDGANIHYIDITPGAPEYGSDRGRSFGYTTGQGLYRCQHPLTMGNSPHEPLLPGHTYAAYLTSDIRSADAEPPVQDADFAAMLAGSRPSGDAALANAWDAYAPFRAYLADQSIAAGDIAVAAVFTVQDSVGRALRLAQAVDAEPVPVLSDLTLCDTGVPSPCDDGGSRVCGAADPDFHEIHGRFRVPMYQDGTTPFETPADGGGMAITGAFVKQSDADVCFALTIPKTATMPAGGWPVVVYGHGTGGSFRGVVGSGVARALATASSPAAVLAFDGVVHGERAGQSTRDADSLMFNVINPRAARDNNLQGAADVLQALRIPQAADLVVTGAGTIALDPAATYYFGHSQGSNVGAPAIAVTDLTEAAVFSGAGAFLIEGLLNKKSPVDARTGLELLIGEELGRDHPVMIIWQTYFDSIDPVNFVPLLLRSPPPGVPSKHVLQTWGSNDTYSPQSTLNMFGRGTGLSVAMPVIQDLGTGTASRPVSLNRSAGDSQQRTGAQFQYVPDGYDGHFVATRNPSAIADWTAFFTSLIATGTPTVP